MEVAMHNVFYNARTIYLQTHSSPFIPESNRSVTFFYILPLLCSVYYYHNPFTRLSLPSVVGVFNYRRSAAGSAEGSTSASEEKKYESRPKSSNTASSSHSSPRGGKGSLYVPSYLPSYLNEERSP